MRKIVLILIIALVASLSVASVSAGWFGDDVNVKEVGLEQFPQFDKFTIVLVPTTDIDHVNEVYLKNVEIKYPDQTYKWDTVNLAYHNSDADNIVLDQANSLLKDYQYELFFKYTNIGNINRNTDSYHIKADVVVDTTTQDGVVVGHIDTDTKLLRNRM